MSCRVGLVLLRGSSASVPTHLQLVISSYLGPPPNVTLSETCSFGSIVLLDWMWEASCTRASERTPWWSLTNFLRSEPHYYRWQFAESMKVAAERGDSAVVEWLLEHFRGCVVPGCVVDGAAGNGHLDVLDLLWNYADEQQTVKKRKVVACSGETVFRSSSGKNVVCWRRSIVVGLRKVDVVRWLHEHIPLKNEVELEDAIETAVDNGDWEIAKFLLPPGRCLLDYADFCSPPKMVEWLLECGYLQRDSKLAVRTMSRLAVSGENLSLMRRIADQHNPPPLDWDEHWREAITCACTSGAVEMFQWLAVHPTGLRVCEKMRQVKSRRDIAASLGECVLDVGMLQCLYEQELFVADYALEMFLGGIRYNQPLEALQWLVDHLSSSERLLCAHVMDEAAKRGRLEVLQYLQKLQLLFVMSKTCSNAVLSRWCTAKAMDKAAANGHFNVVKWLHASRAEGCTFAAMNGAARKGHLEIVKWLHKNTNGGCTTDAMDRAASGGFLEVIKWLYTNTSAGCTSCAMDNAARGGHLDTLKWLHETTTEGCTVQAINDALEFGHFRVASWLHEHFPQYVPAKLKEWSRAKNSFEELLFRQQHYGEIFTSDFLQGLKNPSRVDSDCDKRRSVELGEGEVRRYVKRQAVAIRASSW